jgi:hypothetical protein
MSSGSVIWICHDLRVWGGCRLSFGYRLEGGKRLLPEPVQVAAKSSESVRIELVKATRAIAGVDHESGLLQHPQVLRDGGAAHREALRELPHGPRAGEQPLEDIAPGRIGESRQGISVSHH